MASTDEAGAVDKRKLLARLLQQAQEDTAARAALVPQVRDARIPLSYAQVRLWLLDQQEPASETYTIATTLALIGELRIDLLQASLDAIAARHEALRTVFRQDRGEPYQVVLPARPVDLPVIDLTGAAVAGVDGETCVVRIERRTVACVIWGRGVDPDVGLEAGEKRLGLGERVVVVLIRV